MTKFTFLAILCMSTFFLLAQEHKKISSEPLLSMGEHLSDQHYFQKISDVILTPEGNIYVLDHGQSKILKYDITGRFLKRFGGKGQGPGEFNNPRQLAYVNGDLWVADYGNGRIQIFKNDEYHDMLKLVSPSMPRNLAVRGDYVIVGSQALIPDFGKLQILSASGSKVSELPLIDVPGDDFGQTTSLWRMFHLSNLGEDRMLLGFYYDNLLMTIDNKGNLLKAEQMDSLYPRYEDQRPNAVFPAGFAAMSFSEGPNESIFVATCNQEKLRCGTLYQLDGKTFRPMERYQFDDSIRAMEYDKEKELFVIAKSTEVLLYTVENVSYKN